MSNAPRFKNIAELLVGPLGEERRVHHLLVQQLAPDDRFAKTGDQGFQPMKSLGRLTN